MSGSPSGSYSGQCTAQKVYNGSVVLLSAIGTMTGVDNITLWAYFECPDVNECSAGLANCSAHATCTNINQPYLPNHSPDSYTCSCIANYTGDGYTCLPICSTGSCNASNGVCSAPDICQCNAGYYGANCSYECNCNKHST